jgi:hypothetical protein
MNTTQLERECRSYARYLIGQAPSAYVVEKYLDFHRRSGTSPTLTRDRFDTFLVGASARGPFWARLADSYASRFRKQSLLRGKVALTLALLECAPPGFEIVDGVPRGGFFGAAIRLAWQALRYALVLAVSIAIFTPVRLAMALHAPER